MGWAVEEATAGTVVVVAVVDGTEVAAITAGEVSGSVDGSVGLGVVAAGVEEVSGSEVAAVVGFVVVLDPDG